ncbi:MAG: hypothetical protein CSB13_04180 [Chloroflexi bacterium]|nr:MAG: hypothetical protein CSB13_04180 [Chloroflexota bacterium]
MKFYLFVRDCLNESGGILPQLLTSDKVFSTFHYTTITLAFTQNLRALFPHQAKAATLFLPLFIFGGAGHQA